MFKSIKKLLYPEKKKEEIVLQNRVRIIDLHGPILSQFYFSNPDIVKRINENKHDSEYVYIDGPTHPPHS